MSAPSHLSSTSSNLTSYSALLAALPEVLGGTDRVSRTVTDAVRENYVTMRRSRTSTWTTAGDANSVFTQENLVTVDSATQTTITTGGGLTNRTEVQPASGTVTTTAPDGSYTVLQKQNGRNSSLTRYASGGQPLGVVNYYYDELGRQNQVAEQRSDYSSATTTYYFNNADQVSGTVAPPAAYGQDPQVTTNYFSLAGRIWKTTLPDNTSVTNDYDMNGLLLNKHGSREYPVQYTYDAQGRMRTMKTWQSFDGDSGAATTTWNYNPWRGWLENKRYADGAGPSYSYTPAGRLKTRVWARGITATYSYNGAGDLGGVSYSDATSAVTYGYDRRGRQTSTGQGSATTTRTYNDLGALLSESCSGGPLAGLCVTNKEDEFLRRTNLALLYQQSTISAVSYSYDGASRLHAITDGANAAAYTYLANSSLIDHIDFSADGLPVMTTTKTYDNLNRLTSIASINSQLSTANSSVAYGYNSANQRTASTNADSCYWVYSYDNLGQVSSGRKYWADGTPVAGQQFEYSFDDIGNRRSAGSGGNQTGGNLHYQSYSANALNQYTRRTVPGYAQSLGEATNTATVSLWGSDGSYGGTWRAGEYFWGELPVNNSTGAVWLTITNLAVLTNGTAPDILTNQTGMTFVRANPESFFYDLDGNLTNDGRWAYTWDAENRLTRMESTANAPAGSKLRLQFVYDAQGRRIEKIVSTNNGTAYCSQSTNLFVYDGWNLLAELRPPDSPIRTYLWGLDLSGSPQGAGGVGGLLAVSDLSTLNNQPSTHFVCYDGNGNVSALVNATDGTPSAQYEYGPFGELLRATGPMAKANPFRFSTKYQDDETGLLYYGYRYYEASTGRWNSRDPISELVFSSMRSRRARVANARAENLYGFVRNDPCDRYDLLGLSEQDVTTILDQFRKTMAEMCKKKQRCDCVVGPIKDIHACFSSVMGCGGQADLMEGDIISILLKLDDIWETEHRVYFELCPFRHQDVKVTPGDTKTSGIDNIVLDTFKGCYTVTRRKVVQMPDPTQNFWLYSYETKCYTCDDFKTK